MYSGAVGHGFVRQLSPEMAPRPAEVDGQSNEDGPAPHREIEDGPRRELKLNEINEHSVVEPLMFDSAINYREAMTVHRMHVRANNVVREDSHSRQLVASGSPTLYYDTSLAFALELSGTATAAALAVDATFNANLEAAFVYGVKTAFSAEINLAALTANDVNPPKIFVINTGIQLRADLFLPRYQHGQTLVQQLSSPAGLASLQTPFCTKLQQLETARLTAATCTLNIITGAQLSAVENQDQTPSPDYTGLDTTKKPWCNWSKTGMPGIDYDGVSYLTGRSSIFCDGLHDGLIVVKAAGFSDPERVPPGKQLKLLIRGSSSDHKKTPTMEVRTIQRAYQWRFPILDLNTGHIKAVPALSKWICAPEKFADGICDCNCGRSDWDCMGERGIPQLYVTEVLDNLNSAVTVRTNCPLGVDKLVEVPEIMTAGTGALPPTCGQILLQPAKYAYCQFGTGLPSSLKINHYTGTYNDGTAFGTTANEKAKNFMKYLWEVIEIDKPLAQNRDVGTMVETLGVSTTTAQAYQTENRPSYVDTELLGSAEDLLYGKKVVQEWCYLPTPPKWCEMGFSFDYETNRVVAVGGPGAAAGGNGQHLS